MRTRKGCSLFGAKGLRANGARLLFLLPFLPGNADARRAFSGLNRTKRFTPVLQTCVERLAGFGSFDERYGLSDG